MSSDHDGWQTCKNHAITVIELNDRMSSQPVSRMHGGDHTLVIEDGGRTAGNQADAWLWQLAGRAVDSMGTLADRQSPGTPLHHLHLLRDCITK